MPTVLNSNFIQVALPILIGFVAMGVWQNRRLDDIIARMGRLESKVDDIVERLTRVEERTSPLRAR